MKFDVDVVYLAIYSFTEPSDNKRDVYLVGIYTTEDKAKKGIEQMQQKMGKEAKYYDFDVDPIKLNETDLDYYGI
jgi:hypothetical protein